MIKIGGKIMTLLEQFKDKVLNKAKSYMSDKNYDFDLISESKIYIKPI